MMNGEWKVKVERGLFALRTDFYLWKPCMGYVEHLTPNGCLVRVPDGEAWEDGPTFSLGGMDTRAMMAALAEALAEEGVKTPNDHMLRGQLDAQTAHLQDLRTLLQLNKTSGDK